MGHATFRVGDLTAVIGDNSADNSAEGRHRAGYNGLWSLVHRTEPASLFVRGIAGLNFEHIFDGHRFDRGAQRDVFFEPRVAPMQFRRVSDAEAELVQPPTQTFHLESTTRFTLVAPHHVDIAFRCVPTQHAFQHGYLGLFWASYIDAPHDKSMYFRQGRLWHQLSTQRHNDESTVRHVDDRIDLRFSEGFPDALYRNLSPLRFDEPFCYGHFRDHVAILMFDRVEGLRFSHSPSGGGVNTEQQTTNPAWDFQYIVPRVEVRREYRFRARLSYRPRCSREEILREVAAWRRSLT